ncbi:MAG TPA: choice-of-anchor P family protein [Terriglobia bacterium]
MKVRDFLTPGAPATGLGGSLEAAASGGGTAASTAPSSSTSSSAARRFLYHAQAVGVAGQIPGPPAQTIQSQAPSVLAVTGGVSSSRVDSFTHPSLLTCGPIQTQVKGVYDQGSQAHITEVTTTIENLKVLDYVTADLISTGLRATFTEGASESSIVPLESKIVNLRVGGSPVSVEIDPALFSALDTFAKLQARLQSDSAFRAAQGSPPLGGTAVCTFATQVAVDHPGVVVEGNAIHLPQFATVYLAELIFQPKLRTIGMLRIELGSTPALALAAVAGAPSHQATGHVMAAHGSSNGEFFPP